MYRTYYSGTQNIMVSDEIIIFRDDELNYGYVIHFIPSERALKDRTTKSNPCLCFMPRLSSPAHSQREIVINSKIIDPTHLMQEPLVNSGGLRHLLHTPPFPQRLANSKHPMRIRPLQAPLQIEVRSIPLPGRQPLRKALD